MATGTYAPWFLQQYFDDSGNPLNAGTIEVFIAGTSTHAAVYSDVTLLSAYANPLTLNSAGRLPSNGSMFLTQGVSYKFLVKTSAGVTIATPDNVSAVLLSSGVDVNGTAGENLTAGQAVYLSDGSGGKSAGQWYKADSANTYSSTTPWVGMVPSSITSSQTGAIRLSGAVTGLSSLTVGALYYLSTSGTITATAPTNRRVIGQADTTTTLVLTADPPQSQITFTSPTINTSVISDKLWVGTCNGRLTLTTAVPVTTADVTAATTLYFTPYGGANIALYDGSVAWTLLSFAQLSIAVPATTSQMYDVFVYNNSGTAALELLAWTNDTTRATALTTQDGVLVKTGATTRRYVGSCRTTTVSGQTEDSAVKRYVWNYYNRVRRPLRVTDSAASWAYSTATIRQANGNTANQVDIVVGFSEVDIDLTMLGMGVVNSSGARTDVNIGIGEDSTSTFTVMARYTLSGSAAFIDMLQMSTRLVKNPAVGRHFYSWNEWSTANATTTWYSTTALGSGNVSTGLTGWIEG